MSKVAQYLQEHVDGEVTVASDVRDYFATDGSIFHQQPAVVMYPLNEQDVRKAARFAWQLAERGRFLPITARGSGTDQGGAAIGSGVMMVFPAHMNKVLELDSKTGLVAVQPGTNYGKLQQTLKSHSRYIPAYPASLEYSTIGGAIANNAGGERSFKYGKTNRYIKKLRVVLANGEVIETGRLSKRELNRKLGLANFEGEVYRALDKLYEEHGEILTLPRPQVTKNSAGYNIWDVKGKDGSFDLTPLFVGAQGTLGLITEAVMSTEPYNAQTTLLVAAFDDIRIAEAAITEFRAMHDGPAAIELVDQHLLQIVDKQNPNTLKGLLEKPFAPIVLLIEFDGANERHRRRNAKQAQKILEKYEISYQLEHEAERQAQLWGIRRSAAAAINGSQGHARALPIIEDGIVPPEKLPELIAGLYRLLDQHHLTAAVWGHAGDANLHVQPYLDLAVVGDRQAAFKLMASYHNLVQQLGGSTTGEHGDGRLRGPALKSLYGEHVYSFFQHIKHAFDPYNIMNPGVKINLTEAEVTPLLRKDYNLKHLHDHLPHS